jgi:hypothetical protein
LTALAASFEFSPFLEVTVSEGTSNIILLTDMHPYTARSFERTALSWQHQPCQGISAPVLWRCWTCRRLTDGILLYTHVSSIQGRETRTLTIFAIAPQHLDGRKFTMELWKELTYLALAFEVLLDHGLLRTKVLLKR